MPKRTENRHLITLYCLCSELAKKKTVRRGRRGYRKFPEATGLVKFFRDYGHKPPHPPNRVCSYKKGKISQEKHFKKTQLEILSYL